MCRGPHPSAPLPADARRFAATMILARTPRHALARALLLVAATLSGQVAAQDPLAPPRGFYGPGPGDAAEGGPGDPGGRSVTDSGSWTRWWAFNREAYLVAARGIDPAVLHPATLGAGSSLPMSPWRPDEARLHGDAIPEILAVLGRTRDLDVQRAAVMALAKIGPLPKGVVRPKGLGVALDGIQEHLTARNEAVQNAAVLGLGIHEPHRDSPPRIHRPGREARSRGAWPDRTDRQADACVRRPHAGDRRARHASRGGATIRGRRLLDILEAESDETDLSAAAVIGLGLCPVPFAEPEREALVHRRAVFDALTAFLGDERADLRARAQAPVALARQSLWPAQGTAEANAARGALRRLALDRLTALIGPRATTHPLIREGVCQALGLLAGHEPGAARLAGRDVSAVAALMRMADEGQEREAGLSMIALARIAARGPVPADALTIDLRTQLGTWAAQARPSRRPWASLALGVLLHERARLGGAPALGSLALLERRLRAASSPEEEAAAAIALGLAGAADAAEALAARLDRVLPDPWTARASPGASPRSRGNSRAQVDRRQRALPPLSRPGRRDGARHPRRRQSGSVTDRQARRRALPAGEGRGAPGSRLGGRGSSDRLAPRRVEAQADPGPTCGRHLAGIRDRRPRRNRESTALPVQHPLGARHRQIRRRRPCTKRGTAAVFSICSDPGAGRNTCPGARASNQKGALARIQSRTTSVSPANVPPGASGLAVAGGFW